MPPNMKAPGITQWIPLPYGYLQEFLRDPLTYQLRAREQFGDVFRTRFGLLVHFLYHPDHVRRVLFDHQKNYPRSWHYHLLRRLLGDGLVSSEGEAWRRQRRLSQPAFHRQRLSGYVPTMVAATDRMLDRWESIATENSRFEISSEMSRLTLAVAGLTLFSRDPSHEADVVGRTFSVLANYLEQRFNHPFTSLPTWIPTRQNQRMKDATRTLNGVVLEIIRERKCADYDQGDLLSMLLSARDEETGEAMTEDQVRSEALTFLVAGQETTATALTWTWFLLASRPAFRRQVREEVARVLGDRRPTIDDYQHLTTTRRVLEESMRLYPPVWAIARQAAEDDEVGGYRIPARSTVIVSPFVTHRHPDFWEKPDEFSPDRFTLDQVARRPKGAYFPFLGGPHQCIGNEFAMLEMTLIIAMVLQRFDVVLLPGQSIRPKASLTLQPSGPVYVAIQRNLLS